MKTALLVALAALAADAAAVEVQPAPGMNLDPTSFTDLRLALGLAGPITEAEAAGVVYEADPAPGAHIGVQWVHGTVGDWLGAALGVELAYDDHTGEISKATGVQTVYGIGDTRLRAVTIGLLPKLVLRPDYNDPFDWGPGSVQFELGPVIAAGVGWARIGGSPMSDPTAVLRVGGRLEVVWTDNDHLWQFGLSLAYEAVTAEPDLSGDAEIGGDGVCGSLIFGRRL